MPGCPARRWLLLLALIGVGCGGGWPEATRVPGSNVLVIGLDGAAWKVMGPMIRAGELPTFARLMEEGAYTDQFGVVSPHSPMAWTSMATSRSPEDHGIDGYVTQLANGKKVPITGSQRRVRALWEVANHYGVTTGVANWWATWPAEEIDRWMLTDHANPLLMEFLEEDARSMTADAELLRSLNRDFHPPDLGPTLERYWMSTDELDYEALQEQAQLSDGQRRKMEQAPWHQRELYSVYKLMYLTDSCIKAASVALMKERPTELTMVYLRGPDGVQHYGWDLVEPGAYDTPAEDFDGDFGLVQSIYRYLDGYVAELMAASPPGTWTMVVSDHGAEPNPAATGPVRKQRPGGHTTNAKGVMFIHGPDVSAGKRLTHADPYDVMPTALWLLGLPISEELEGQVLTEAFTEEMVAARSVPRVASYGGRETGRAEESLADPAMMENLRALGYIE